MPRPRCGHPAGPPQPRPRARPPAPPPRHPPQPRTSAVRAIIRARSFPAPRRAPSRRPGHGARCADARPLAPGAAAPPTSRPAARRAFRAGARASAGIRRETGTPPARALRSAARHDPRPAPAPRDVRGNAHQNALSISSAPENASDLADVALQPPCAVSRSALFLVKGSAAASGDGRRMGGDRANHTDQTFGDR